MELYFAFTSHQSKGYPRAVLDHFKEKTLLGKKSCNLNLSGVAAKKQVTGSNVEIGLICKVLCLLKCFLSVPFESKEERTIINLVQKVRNYIFAH